MAKEENVGWKTTLGMISSKGKTAPGPGRCNKIKQRRNRGWGEFTILVCKNSAPEPFKAQTFPIGSQHCQVSMAKEEQTLPFSLWFRQQGWELGGNSTSL